jgi:hypothetical protein
MCGGYWGNEAQRLAGCVTSLGDAEPYEGTSWDLCVTAAEQSEAGKLIAEALPHTAAAVPPLGLSIGTKQAVNDWGDGNWRAVLGRLADASRPLLLIGGGEERARSQAVAADWAGPVLNF